jgi:hypothetical protein
MGSQPAINLLPLAFRERNGLGVGGDAVPNLLNEGNSLRNTQPFNAIVLKVS